MIIFLDFKVVLFTASIFLRLLIDLFKLVDSIHYFLTANKDYCIIMEGETILTIIVAPTNTHFIVVEGGTVLTIIVTNT